MDNNVVVRFAWNVGMDDVAPSDCHFLALRRHGRPCGVSGWFSIRIRPIVSAQPRGLIVIFESLSDQSIQEFP